MTPEEVWRIPMLLGNAGCDIRVLPRMDSSRRRAGSHPPNRLQICASAPVPSSWPPCTRRSAAVRRFPRPAPAPPAAAPTAASPANSPGTRPSAPVARCDRATHRATRPARPSSGRSTDAHSAALPANLALRPKTARRTRTPGSSPACPDTTPAALSGAGAFTPRVSPDGLTYTFHFRKGVRWHDKAPMNGRQLTAHAMPRETRSVAPGSTCVYSTP